MYEYEVPSTKVICHLSLSEGSPLLMIGCTYEVPSLSQQHIKDPLQKSLIDTVQDNIWGQIF